MDSTFMKWGHNGKFLLNNIKNRKLGHNNQTKRDRVTGLFFPEN